MFLNSSFGLGPDVSQAGLSTFPVTAPAVRVRLNWTPGTYFMAGVYDGMPGDPEDPYGTHAIFDEGDGVFTIGEAGVIGQGERYYKVGIGGWYRTTEAEDPTGSIEDDNSGIYVIGETDVWREDSGRGLGVFAQLGFADEDRNQVGTYVGGGLNWTGPFAQRPQDVAGLAVAHARNGDDFRAVNAGLERAETTIEASYLITPRPWLTVQPDVQYIIDPGTDANVDNALVLGVRLQLTL